MHSLLYLLAQTRLRDAQAAAERARLLAELPPRDTTRTSLPRRVLWPVLASLKRGS